MDKRKLSRRRLMAAAGATAAVMIVPRHVIGGEGQNPPSERLNIAAIGVGGMGSVDIGQHPTENIVAICDVDQRHLGAAAKRFPKARTWVDFREMLDKQKDIDAVTIATPDHLHAFVTMAALKRGKHVYCQKPLTHSPWEARQIAKAAAEAKVATQMGNQGQASEEARITCETIWAGAIGNVTAIHAWSNRKPDISPRGVRRPADKPPVPEWLNWDLWVGPSQMRPYHPCYLPFSWRGWWDFGTGCLGDIGCHQLSTTFKCLKLKHPKTIEASSTNWQQDESISRETAPLSSMVRWHFEADENHGPLDIIWYDGGMMPPRPDELEPTRRFGVDDGIMYVGDKGKMLEHRLIPETRAREFGRPPRKLERSIGQYKEWTTAAKGGKPAGSNFVDHAGHLAEVVLLGNVAIRTACVERDSKGQIRTNQKLTWDPQNMKCINCPEADQFINTPYRPGWALERM